MGLEGLLRLEVGTIELKGRGLHMAHDRAGKQPRLVHAHGFLRLGSGLSTWRASIHSVLTTTLGSRLP